MNSSPSESTGFNDHNLNSPVIDIEEDPVSDEAEDLHAEAPSLPGELPMIVWVRGDEPYATEFFLEADDVMALLGIKRSRLTQISGRELRVGRRRVGRYIRPFYREVDVKAYKEWTRPTAAHAKSKEFVDQALHQLQDLGSHLQENLLTDLASLKITSDAAWEQTQRNQQIQKARYENLLTHSKMTHKWLQQLQQEQEQSQASSQNLEAKIKFLAEQQRLQQQQLQDLLVQMLSMQQQVQDFYGLFEALARDAAQQSLALREMLQKHFDSQSAFENNSKFFKFSKNQMGCTLNMHVPKKMCLGKKSKLFLGFITTFDKLTNRK